tara:strand:- start:2333 stop:3292 length:960 start_codon:yes stop_codon:yes gene_type:complete
MELKHARCFLAVYEEGSITDAAKRLHATQPGVSILIGALEEEFGLRLFERHAKGVRPTVAGKRFYRRASALVESSQSAVKEMQKLSNKVSGRLAIGVPPTISKVILAQTLAAFTTSYPDVEMRIVEAYSKTLISMLHSRELDFAIVTYVPDQAALVLEKVYQDRLALVSGRALGLEPMRPVRLDQSPGFKLVIPSLRNGLLRLLDEPIQTGQIRADRFIEIDGLTGTLDFVAATDWASLQALAPLVHEQIVRSSGAATLSVNPICGPEIKISYFISRLASQEMSTAGDAFVDLARKALDRITDECTEILAKVNTGVPQT